MNAPTGILFETATPLGFTVRVYASFMFAAGPPCYSGGGQECPRSIQDKILLNNNNLPPHWRTKPAEFNHRMHQMRQEGMAALRVWSYPAKGKQCPRLRVKCGCCDGQVVIWHDADGEDMEINGVCGSVENWREVLLPLLERKPPASKKARTKNAAASSTKPAASRRKK